VNWCGRILSAVAIVGELVWQHFICSGNCRWNGVAKHISWNHEIRHTKLHTDKEALSFISICKSVLTFAKRGFNFFSVCGFSWKKGTFSRRCCIQINKSKLLRDLFYLWILWRWCTGVCFRPVDTEVEFSAGYISGL